MINESNRRDINNGPQKHEMLVLIIGKVANALHALLYTGDSHASNDISFITSSNTSTVLFYLKKEDIESLNGLAFYTRSGN
jgi:hypothetical protein